MSIYVTNRFLDVLCYLMLVGMIEVAVLGLAAAVALAWLPFRGRRWYVRRLANWALFAFILLACGCAGNSVFMLIAYEHLYVSADTVVDFFPFIPFGQWVLDADFGSIRGRLLGGASLRELQAVWAGIAVAVWCGSTAIYMRASRLLGRLLRGHEAA
jgi:hypothetical protein